MKHDAELLAEIRREKAERSLAEFTRQAWPIIQTVAYKHGWHIDVIAEHLEACARQELSGVLAINIPFRCMKSLLTSVFFPAWLWAQNPRKGNPENELPLQPGTWMGPGAKVLTVSHSQEMAKRDAVFTRRILQSEWYQKNWGGRVALAADQNEKQRYGTTRGGLRLAMARSGVLGEGGDIVIADDLIDRQQAHSEGVRLEANEYWGQTLRSRFTDPDRSIFILIMQRLHEMDPTGYALATEPRVTHLMLPMEYEPERKSYTGVRTSVGGQDPIEARYIRRKQIWVPEGDFVAAALEADFRDAETEVVYSADPRTVEKELLWPNRFGPTAVATQKTVLTSYGAAGQLQQRPAPREGGMFKRAWFEFVDAAPAGTRWVRHWDLAATKESKKNPNPAWTAGLKLGHTPSEEFIVADVKRVRDEGNEVSKLIKQTAIVDGRGVEISLPQDPGQAGKVQAKNFVKMLAGWKVYAVGESGDKETRAEPVAAQAEAGNFKLLKGAWNEPFLDEITIFPNGAMKDQVDSLSGAFARLTMHRPATTQTSTVGGLI